MAWPRWRQYFESFHPPFHFFFYSTTIVMSYLYSMDLALCLFSFKLPKLAVTY
jgi:hypothetical protein